jgi:O-antigen ligase
MVQAALRNRFASLAIAGMLFAQLLAFGADGGTGAAVFALVEIVSALVVILLAPEAASSPIWTRLAPIMLLFLAALAWAAAPLLAAEAPMLASLRALAPDAIGLELLKLAGLGAMFVVGALIGLSRTRLRRFVFDVSVIGLVYILIALWIGQASPVSVWGQAKGAHAYRFTGTLLNANAAACVFGMLGLVSLGLMQSLLKRFDLREARLTDYLWLGLSVCAIVAAFGACVLTQSRTGLTLAAIAGAGMVVLEARRVARERDGGMTNRVLLGCTGLVLAAGLGLGATQISSRWNSLLFDSQLRLDAYQHYIGAIAQAPWFGYGLGGFRGLHERLLTPELAPALWDFGAAHSALTQAALEGGLPFLLLLLAAFALITARIARPRGASRRSARRGATLTGIIAAAGLAVIFSFVDIALNVPAIAAFTVVLVGVAWGDAVAREAPAPIRLENHDPQPMNDRISARDWTRG